MALSTNQTDAKACHLNVDELKAPLKSIDKGLSLYNILYTVYYTL